MTSFLPPKKLARTIQQFRLQQNSTTNLFTTSLTRSGKEKVSRTKSFTSFFRETCLLSIFLFSMFFAARPNIASVRNQKGKQQ